MQGKAGSYEHMSGVVKDQNESLAKELSALHRQVCCTGYYRIRLMISRR